MDADSALVDALELSRQHGMLGRRPVPEVIAQAERFLPVVADVGRAATVVDDRMATVIDDRMATVVDLGSGGGVPGLVVAVRRPDLRLVLVDRRATRTDHLRRLVRRLDLGDRVEVVTADAAALPRLLTAPVAAVIARGFGAPAEFLRRATAIVPVGGVLAVTEPPRPDPRRWPPELLVRYGVEHQAAPSGIAAFRLVRSGTG